MIGLISFVIFFKKFKSKKILYFLISWLLIAPIPASFATGVGYSANRAVAMIPALQILAGLGLFKLMENYKKSYIVLGIIGAIGLLVFMQKYLISSPKLSAAGMLEGNLTKAEEYIKLSNNSDEVIVPRTLSEPHIYIAFVQKTDPSFYQEQTKNWKLEEFGVNWVDQIPEYKLGKFTFKNVE
jgi:hypothetical protein